MSDTGAAKLPGLPVLRTQDQALHKWCQAVAEHLEVRAGSRGNPAERGVTQRELLAATSAFDYMKADKSATVSAGDVVLDLGGGLTVVVAVDAFAQSIFDSRLYKDMMKRLDDQSRFDDVPEEVRKILLLDIAEEAARRGADVVRLEKKIHTESQSLAYTVEEVTAAIDRVSSGVRETAYASAQANLATAGKVTQVQARLDNFNGGGPGTATIEQKMSTIASNVTGLLAEYTIKVQAGGVFGSLGLSAVSPADPTKPSYSQFLVAADVFGIVFPGNAGGADAKRIPFGIDSNGLYMNSDVYIKGTMRVDYDGKTLLDGLRGSLNLAVTGSWSDTAARNAICTNLGKSSSNIYLVIGDSVTATTGTTSVTKYWNGSSWIVPGVVVSGGMIVDGGLSASKIDTRMLTIKNAAGEIIFGSGANGDGTYIKDATIGTLHLLDNAVSGVDCLAPVLGTTQGTMTFTVPGSGSADVIVFVNWGQDTDTTIIIKLNGVEQISGYISRGSTVQMMTIKGSITCGVVQTATFERVAGVINDDQNKWFSITAMTLKR